jgi:TMEM175 potassium channel family protein
VSVINWVRWLAMARAPGGKAGADSPSVQRDTGRLVAFSDAVFAITITLLVLEIRPPTDYSHLLHGLLALWSSYLAYGVTFLFIGQVWANHRVMFDHIRAADRVVLLFNTLLLMAVAFLPFATSVLAGALRSGHGQRTAVFFYGIAFDVTALTSTPCGDTRAVTGCSATRLTLLARQRSAGAFSSPWPGSRLAPWLAQCYPSWAWSR